MAEDIRISVGADTTQMESQIANAARKATVVIRPTIDSKGLEKISAPLGRITGQADEFSKSMEAANARVLAFGASVGVLNAVAKSFQNIVTASTQVEASLKEIQVATGETSGNLEKLGKGIFEVARSTGLSFKQASEATLEFARQGGTLEDSLMKAKAALVLTRTTGLDAAEAVKGLTAAVLSFNQVGLDYETVVNKLAAVDTKFAVSSRDLIEGISRSASVAQEAGVSFDELTALITTLQEKTARGGAVIGNALKTIFQRVQTTENLDYIRNLGIAVNDVSGDILPATTIIKKLADEFQNLDSATRKGLLIKIGGGFQIDKLAALLNDISSANGTFNRSLEQSSNAGNQGFRKLEELNKTVQASFDRLTTSGTEFAATVGKIAFSDDFRSILNKTSSFLESLNESISGGEEGGATIGKSIVKGIGSIITGPGALLLAGLGIKLFGDLAKFGVDSLKNQLGVTNVKKEQQDIEKSILGLLLQNTAVQSKIVSLEGNKAAQAEYLLGLYSKQAATLEKMSKLSKDIGPSVYESGIRLTTEGTKNVKSKTAAGGYMSKDAARKMEMQEAPAGASIREISNFNFGPTEGKGTMIVNSMESVYKTPMGDFVVPSYSKTRTGKPTLFSASGYVPNFAEEKQKENLLRNLNIDGGAYSFAGLTIGGTGSKAVRAKEVTPQILSQVKDPVLSEALSKYSKLNFSNVSVGNIYRRRDENLDSLQASEKDIKDHFVKKANSALSPQIGTFIKDELSSLGIKPTATMQYLMKNGRKFDFVNDSMAGTFFETMLKMANMSAEDDNFGQFFNDSNSRFDIYGLKPDIAEQYGLPKKFWEYVEIKSSEKALNDEIGTKFIQQLSQAGGESLKSKFLAQAKTGAKGYVPNFAINGLASNIEVLAGRVFESLLRGDEYLNLTENNIAPDIDKGYYKVNEAKMSVNAALVDSNFGKGKGKGNSVIVPKDSSTENDEALKRKKGSKITRPNSEKFLRGNIFKIARKILERESKNKNTNYSKIKMATSAAEGYVPNFAGTTNFEGSASRYGYKIGQVYNKGEEAIKATFNNPTTAFSGTVTGKESYGRKYGVTVDEKGIIASILGNNTFVAGKDQRRLLESLATRLSSQGAMVKGSGFNIAGLQGGRLATNPDQVITANIKGKFKKIDYEKLDKIFPRFWKSKGLGDVWEKTKLAATYKASPTSYSEIIKDRPDLQETLSSSSLLRQNNTLLRDAAVEAVLKRDPSVAGFLVDIANSGDEAFLKQQGYGGAGIKYAMPFSGKPFSDIENKAVKEEEYKLRKEYQQKGVFYGDFLAEKEKYLKFGKNWKYASGRKFLQPDGAKTAAKGYVPNFASGDVDGDGTVTRNDPFIKKLMDSAKKFSPVAKELTNNIIGNLLNMPEGVDLFEIIEQLKFVQKTQEPEAELNRIKREASEKRKNEKREEFLKRYKGTPEGSASRGYIPNFSKEAVLDAIDREQKESGLPLSAIKVVQDARVRGARNPDGYAVINNRDEPDGRVPNFAVPTGMDPELFKALEDSIKNVIASTNPLKDGFDNIVKTMSPFGVTLEQVTKIADDLTSPLNEVAKTSKKITEEGKKEADGKGKAVKETKESKDKETKTVQDSLYTLLKWQTVLSFTSGALSAFGEKTSKIGEALNSFGTAALSATEGIKAVKGITIGENKNLIGKDGAINKAIEGAKSGFKAQGLAGAARGFVGAGGLGAAAGAATGAGVLAIATVEILKGLDGALELFDGSIQKSADTMDNLIEIQKKFGISLSESQKRIVESSSSSIGSGRGISGYFNQSQLFMGVLNPFSTKLEDSLRQAFSQTGLSESANKQIYSTIAMTQEPIAEQKLKRQRQEELKAQGKNVPLEEIKIPSSLIQEELQKQSLNVLEQARKNVLTGYENDAGNIQVPRKYEMKDIGTGGKPKFALRDVGENTDSEEYKKKQELTEKIKKGQADTKDIVYEMQKILEDSSNESNKILNTTKLVEESFLYSSKYLAIQLSTSAELLKIQNSIASSEENLLKFKKDNIQTSEAEKIFIDYKLQKLESERNLRSDIQQAVLKGAEEEVNAFKNRKGNVTQEEADLINKLYENLAKAAGEGRNVAEILNQFVKELNNVDEGNEKFIGSLAQIGKGLDLQVGVLKQRTSTSQEESRRAQLLSAINTKISYEYNAQKQFLMDKIAIQQKGLDIAREEAGLARNIRDSKFNVSLIGKTPRQQQIAQLQRQASGITGEDELKDLQNTRSQAALAARSKLMQSILEKDTTINPQDLENLSQQELKNKFIGASTLKGTQLDTTVDQLSIFQTKAGTAGDIVISKFSDAGDKIVNAADKVAERFGIPSVQQPSGYGAYDANGVPITSKDNNVAQTGTSTELPAETQTGLNKAREMAKNAQSRAEMEYNRILSENALPKNKEASINQDDLERRLKALDELNSMTKFSGGMRNSMAAINDEIDSFGNTLGKQIPLDFRNGLVDAMKALSDPNSTASLKERLMGVATSFLNKINEAFMQNTANKITQNIGNFFNQGGGQGFASGGAIKGGSGTKDDVPAMLMGGEYVIRKNVVNKYGKDFFDRLNAGKVKGFANGGMAGFDIADNKDTVLNPTKYTPYGQTRAGGLSFDDNGKVIGMDSYTGTEENKNKALLEAQTKFYQGGAQTGEGGFFMPGTYGKGAIMGQQNLLNYVTQQTTGTQFDKFSNTGGGSSIDIAAGSSNLSLFALRDQGNLKNAQYLESKNKALDLYFGGIGAEKDKIKMDEENRKQYEELKKQIEDAKKQAKKQLVTQLVTAVASAAISAAASSMAKGWSATNQASGGKATFGEKFSGMFTGGTMGGESRGGLANMFSSSGYKDFSIIGKAGGGLQEWNSSLGGYTDMSPLKYESMYQPLQNAGRLSYDSLGSPVINSFRGPSSGFNLSNINPMNWFGKSATSNRSMMPVGGLNMLNMGFGGITSDQAFSSPLDSVIGMTEKQKRDYIRSQTVRKAAGGTIQGNGMGDNVPAMLNGGEFVMSRQASQRIGYGNLQQMNSSNAGTADSEGIVSRLESKLEELIEKVTGVGTINISVTSDGKGGRNESENSNNQDQQNREMARRMKEVVLGVLRDEKRLGGLLR